MSEDTVQKLTEAVGSLTKKVDCIASKQEQHLIDQKNRDEETAGFSIEYIGTQKNIKELLEARSNIKFLFKTVLGTGALAAAWTAIFAAFHQH